MVDLDVDVDIDVDVDVDGKYVQRGSCCNLGNLTMQTSSGRWFQRLLALHRPPSRSATAQQLFTLMPVQGSNIAYADRKPA